MCEKIAKFGLKLVSLQHAIDDPEKPSDSRQTNKT
jgi:hypothetical protein